MVDPSADGKNRTHLQYRLAMQFICCCEDAKLENTFIPTADMYKRYEEFCRAHRMKPTSHQVFGKFVFDVLYHPNRAQLPTVATNTLLKAYPCIYKRRLGTRAHRSWVYVGLSARSTAPEGRALR